MVLEPGAPPELLAGLGVEGADQAVALADHRQPAAGRNRRFDDHGRRARDQVVDRPADAAGMGVERVELARTVGDEQPVADHGGLAAAGHGEGPFDLEPRHVGRRQARVTLEAGGGVVDPCGGPVAGRGPDRRIGRALRIGDVGPLDGDLGHLRPVRAGRAGLGLLARGRGQIGCDGLDLVGGQALRHRDHDPAGERADDVALRPLGELFAAGRAPDRRFMAGLAAGLENLLAGGGLGLGLGRTPRRDDGEARQGEPCEPSAN